MTARAIALVSARVPGSLADVWAERGAPEDGAIPYRIVCPCGGARGLVTSEHDEEENFWLDPIVFTCADCGRSATLFDSRSHGYDAILNSGGTYVQRTRDEHVPCHGCGELEHEVTAWYRYDLEEDELEELSAEAPLPDLFTSIAFLLVCAACGSERHLADFECA